MEELKSFFITVAEIVSSITIIVGGLMAFEKYSKGKLSNWLLNTIKTDIKEIKEKVHNIELDNLKLIVMTDTIPLNERIQAGTRYIDQGGNGEIKIHVKLLKEEYEESVKNK